MKILFVIQNMNVGGIQRSLSELLCALSHKKEYEITLFCICKEGVYLERVPDNIKIIYGNLYSQISEKTYGACKADLSAKYAVLRLLLSGWTKIFGKRMPARVLCRLIGRIDGVYDVAVAYSQPLHEKKFCNLTNEMVLKCCNAKKKISFLHCDFASYGGDSKANRKLYLQFDAIAAVSDSVGKRFAEIVSDCSDKVHTVYNLVNKEDIINRSLESTVTYSKDTVVTVARLSEEKGLLRCVPIISKLHDEGYDFEWHIVGGGYLFDELSACIKLNKAEEYIFMHGEQTNPYRYIKNAKYLLLPSFHEAAPMVFDEAAVLGVPILTTRTLSADELVEKNGIGYVCDNDDNSIFNMIKKALSGDFPNCTGTPRNAEQSLIQFDKLCKKLERGE